MNKTRFISSVLALCITVTVAAETLYNGITLPSRWPPEIRHFSREPMPVPYLLSLPDVVPIDVGRQLFVDDFLIERTDLKRSFYSATIHPASPILIPDKPWEARQQKPKDPPQAFPFSDGVWYDPKDNLFKMWYVVGFNQATAYAYSADGLQWTKPDLDIEPGTNIVHRGVRDSATVWLNLEAADPARRFILHRRGRDPQKNWRQIIHFSPDGIHWSEPAAMAGASGDRSTFFCNPFRKKWVFGIRCNEMWPGGPETASPEFSKSPKWDYIDIGRIRRYAEGDTIEQAVQSWPWPKENPKRTMQEFIQCMSVPTIWVGADRLDPPRPDIGTPCELYNLDAVAYESLMVGLLTIWRGVPANYPARDKINEVCVGFSRDGFHWDRPCRRPLVGVSEDPQAWNYSNVQSAGGCFLIVGDQLYFYVSGRQQRDVTIRPGFASTGLATLRRDGFASMDAADKTGTLTTRPVRFSGKYLFVNVDNSIGRLRAEVLDRNGNVIKPFTLENCIPLSADSTRRQIRWKTGLFGPADLSLLAGKPVRFRFELTNGRLYSFWVSPDKSGASHGYTAAGGPGFTTPRDTVGANSIKLDSKP
jgi:hypothetical protein